MEMNTKDRFAVDDCADYLLKYRKYLRYDQYLAAGLPISTGVIEGACRHLVKDRMDITGACWGCTAPKPYSSAALSVPAATSMPTGLSTRAPNMSATISTSTPPRRRPLSCR